MAPRILFYVFLLTVARAAASQQSGNGDSNATLTFVEEPRDVVVTRNRSALLDCSVRSGEQGEASVQADQFHIIWFQNGQPIPLPDPRRDVLPNGSLFFKQVLHKRFGRNTSDEGFFHCLARNSIGALVSRNASVRVAALAREFTTTPADVSTEVNDVVRFWCRIESVPEAVITWEKDGQPLEAVATDDLGGDSSSARSSSRCVARNQLAEKERRSSAGRLLVIPRSEGLRGPQFISPPMSPSSLLWTPQGSNLTLECLATGNPTPTVTRWTLNGTHELVPSAKITIHPSFLLLTDVDASMSGEYTCTVTDGANATVSQTTTVEVTTQPFILKMPKSQVFPTAKTVRFECEVGGHPAPDVRWLKDGRVLPIIGRIKQRVRNGGSVSELVLSNTVTADSGIYQCVAENIAGYVSASARLLVNVTEGRPEPPSNLQAVAVSPTDILLTWDAPRNVPVDEIKAYTVHYTPVDGGEELQEVSITARHRVENLKRNTNYTFYVRAYIRKSASDQSERITCDTGDGAPLVAPNITLVPLSPTTLKVVWRKFPNETNRPVSLYKIQYRRHRAREFDIEVVKGDVLEYTITGLHPGKKYDVRVLPGSLNMDGQWYTKEMPRVGDPNQLAAPSLQLLSTNSTSITVMWEAPTNSRKQADCYKLLYQQQGGKPHGPLTLAAEQKLFVIGNLSANTAYEVHLWSHADDKDGPASVRTIRTLFETSAELDTNAAFDEPVVQLEAEALSWNSLKMSWQLPPAAASGTSNVAFYTVRYVTVVSAASNSVVGNQHPPGLLVPLPLPVPPGTKTSTTSAVDYLRTTLGEVELKNLSAYTTYQLSVRYHDANGRYSIFSPGIDVQTWTHIPSTPQNISCQALDGAIVQLSWQPPLEPNGVILGYTILVSQNQSLAVDLWSKQEEPGSRFRTQVRELLPNTFYYIRMQARTSAGAGPLTNIVTVITVAQNTDENHPAKGATHSTNIHDITQDQHMGVFIGLAIGSGFLIVTSLFLLWRSRNCIKNSSPERRDAHSSMLSSSQRSQLRNGGAAVAHVNGNGFHKQNPAAKKKFGRSRNNSETQPPAQGSMVEMEAFVPMLSTIPVDVTSHLDTKGGYPTVSRFNRRSSLSNGSVLRTSNETVDGDPNHTPLLEQSVSQGPCTGRRYCFSSGLSLEDSQAIAVQNTTTTTVLSQTTDDTCWSLHCGAVDSGGTRSHSHDSSLQSLGASSEDHLSHSRSTRSLEDNDTGICNVDQSVDRWEETTPTTPIAEVAHSDPGTVVSFAGCLSTTTPIRESGELVM